MMSVSADDVSCSILEQDTKHWEWGWRENVFIWLCIIIMTAQRLELWKQNGVPDSPPHSLIFTSILFFQPSLSQHYKLCYYQVHSKNLWVVLPICLLPELCNHYYQEPMDSWHNWQLSWLPSFVMLFIHDLEGSWGRGEGIFIANIKQTPAACSRNTQQVFLHVCHDVECFSMYPELYLVESCILVSGQ